MTLRLVGGPPAPPPPDPHTRVWRNKWAAGQVNPATITLALDAEGMYGPEVDEQLGGTEPMVDEWETGDRYPTWEQLVALSDLTGYPLGFFFRPTPDVQLLGFTCRVGGCDVNKPSPKVLFTRAALIEAGVTTTPGRTVDRLPCAVCGKVGPCSVDANGTPMRHIVDGAT